ncbi:MAG: hypothetical protein M1360_03450 [Candidatus Marsarchaeota archaeon]|nr:hypothetical protein [Candidatus Marsarchaeota archaeon]MCL5418969.1 hypothetical protein [Candidatus Marsarchaeota archaeon]
MNEIDENLKKQMANAEAFKKAIESGQTPEYLSQIEKVLKPLKDEIRKIPYATLDEDKCLKDYDYYNPIQEEFANIYKTLNESNLLNSLSMGPKIDMMKLENKIEKADLEEKVEIANKLFKTLGSKVNIDSSDNLYSKKLKDGLFIGWAERLMKDPSLNKKLEKLYFAGINHIAKAIEEYAYISKKLKEISDSRLHGFILQLLYLKAYEENLHVLSDAYTNVTGKDKKSFEGLDEYYKSFNQFISEHNILNETMDKGLRDSIAHNTYGKLEAYAPEKILELARRNFITSIIGIVIKTNRIIESFEDNSSKIAIY